MPIPLDSAAATLNAFDNPRIANLFGQAQARYVLLEVREEAANFPRFDRDLDEKSTAAAYSLLAAGCSLAERERREEGTPHIERAATLLHALHAPLAVDTRESAFHALIAAMAFYASGQYSRAFVGVRRVEATTNAAQMIAAFLRKDPQGLLATANAILLADTPAFEDQLELDEWAITLAVARALSLTSEFTLGGDPASLAAADEVLRHGLVIAAEGNHAAWWWIVRLLRLMVGDLGTASLWRVLPPYFAPDAAQHLSKYIRLLAFAKRPITELWSSQRTALPLALDRDNRGAVINLRTSAGKTRVAELAILQAILTNPDAKILYLAPFRSLAVEVEQALSATLSWLGCEVSHLYGGHRLSTADAELAAEATVTIATPEKARALLRSAPELFRQMRLFIIDEGHLIGATERHVRNEVFVDRVRQVARANDARILLLSAVLPNPQELAAWITGDDAAVAKSQWKPSAERFGLLRWNGTKVRLVWRGEFESFNPSFVEARALGFGKRRKLFPANKTEAIAATAIRLSASGPVMVFTGRAVSVPTIAEGALLAMGERPAAHPWPDHEWRVFEAVCREELEPDAIELRAARAGVVCHSNRLTPQVRLAIESLMRSYPPRVIVATTTLAQGVNVGVASVIIASPYISEKRIDRRDFWNICGRAGRAFVDGEGKVLYAIDDTATAWQIRNNEELAEYYFAGTSEDRVESGLLFVVRLLRRIAQRSGVSFEQLLEMAANNEFAGLGELAKNASGLCDLFDDELLAVLVAEAPDIDDERGAAIVDSVFRESLAFLQARMGPQPEDAENVIRFLTARSSSILRRVPVGSRRAIVASGLPLSVAVAAHAAQEAFRREVDAYRDAGQTADALAAVVKWFEQWARQNGAAVSEKAPAAETLDAIRASWLIGIGLEALTALDADAPAVTKDFYGYQLPWIIHAASQQLRSADDPDRADTLARIALLVELGLPNEPAAKVFLAGIKSRVAATELSLLDGLDLAGSIPELRAKLRNPDEVRVLVPRVSETTAAWLRLLGDRSAELAKQSVPQFESFVRGEAEGASMLFPRQLGDRVFLSSVDGRVRVPVESTPLTPFREIANDPRVAFRRAGAQWELELRDPRLTQ